MERAVVLSNSDEIDVKLLRSLLPGVEFDDGVAETEDENLHLEPAVTQLERKLILRALGMADDNKAQAARLLAISERTLWYKLKKYNI
jgi:two-component system response regulator AtoC